MKIFAMVSKQGTACEETALCEEHYTAENKVKVEARTWKSDPGVLWEDCTGNEVLECTVCGQKE